MREVRELVGSLERLRRAAQRAFRVAQLVRHRARRHREPLVLRHDVGRAQAEGGGLVPFGDQRVAAFLRRPVILRQHRDAVGRRRGKGDHVHDTRDLLRLRCVEALELRAEARRMQHHRGQHPGELHVLCELRAAVRFGARIGARERRFADVDEVLRILEQRRGRHHLGARGGRELAELRALLRLLVLDHAARHGDFRRRHAPALGGGADQHHARRGAGLAQLLVGIGQRARAAGALHRAPH